MAEDSAAQRETTAALLGIIDDCLERDSSIDVVLARVAERAGCAVGVEVAHGGLYGAEPDGVLSAKAPPARSTTRVLADRSRVWVDRRRADLGPDVEVLMRRLGIAVKIALRLSNHADSHIDDLQTVVDTEVETSQREHASQRLGLGGSGEITTYAAYGEDEAVAVFADRVGATSAAVCRGKLGAIYIVLAKDVDPAVRPAVPVGLRASYAGPCAWADLPDAWRHARLALRFARPSPRDEGNYMRDEAVLNDASNTGGYLLLAEALTVAQISQVPDVRRLNHLVRDQGADMLVCLEAVAATDSLRKAAAVLHLHHNSVSQRVERAERYFGFGLTEPYGRTRLFMALVLRRLLESGRLFGA